MKLCIFDLDGTLLNTLGDIADALNVALRAAGLPERTLEEVRMMVGNGLSNVCKEALPAGFDPAEAAAVEAQFRAEYFAHLMVRTAPYPGINDLLETMRLSGVPMAVLSNKPDGPAKELVVHFFPETFAHIQGERPDLARKPDPEGLCFILDRFEAKPEEALYIGDSEVDLATAINAGVKPILCSWGFRGREGLEEAGAEYIIDSPQEVLNHLFNA